MWLYSFWYLRSYVTWTWENALVFGNVSILYWKQQEKGNGIVLKFFGFDRKEQRLGELERSRLWELIKGALAAIAESSGEKSIEWVN